MPMQRQLSEMEAERVLEEVRSGKKAPDPLHAYLEPASYCGCFAFLANHKWGKPTDSAGLVVSRRFRNRR